MRTIRLRFWNTDVTPHVMEYCDLNDIKALEKAKGKHVMLSTDIFDMAGKEIFEGDVISKKLQNGNFGSNTKECEARFLVSWQQPKNTNDPRFNEVPGFSAKEIYNENNYQCMDWSEYADCIVIGNECENPELISNAK